MLRHTLLTMQQCNRNRWFFMLKLHKTPAYTMVHHYQPESKQATVRSSSTSPNRQCYSAVKYRHKARIFCSSCLSTHWTENVLKTYENVVLEQLDEQILEKFRCEIESRRSDRTNASTLVMTSCVFASSRHLGCFSSALLSAARILFAPNCRCINSILLMRLVRYIGRKSIIKW